MTPRILDPLLDLQRYLSHLTAQCYLLLDGSRFPNIYMHLYEVEDLPEFIPLFKGTSFESIMEVSPCLVSVKNCSKGILPWFLEHGADENKGWILTSTAEPKEIATHFKEYLTALLPDSKKVLFRFYDPIIFNIVANCSNSETLLKLSEPCASIIWKNKETFFELNFDNPEQG